MSLDRVKLVLEIEKTFWKEDFQFDFVEKEVNQINKHILAGSIRFP